MRYVLALAALICAGPLHAQTAQWEYGRLYTIRDVPVVWNLADSSVSIDSAAEWHSQALGMSPLTKNPRRIVPLVAVLNRLGAQGWELVAVLPEQAEGSSYIFKRRRG